jgi:hypothetical protein
MGFIESPCYRFEKRWNQGPTFFDSDSIDATYVLHLEGNGRLDHVEDQLKRFPITQKTYILFNKGYKNCQKNLHEEIPPVDLVDAFLYTFRHAKEQGYNNILILEDDFIFNETIRDQNVHNHIQSFLKRNANRDFLYCLGCLPYIQLPYHIYHRRVFTKAGTHAVIYSRELRENILLKDQKAIYDWDIYTNGYTCFMYYKPLCYQLFPETENSNYHSYSSCKQIYSSNDCDHPYFFIYIKKMSVFFNQLVKLNKKEEPGYSIMYWFSFLSFFFIIIIVLGIIFWVYKRFSNMKKGVRRRK